MNEPPGARARVALTGLTVAEYFRDQEGQDVLLFIDNIFRFTQVKYPTILLTKTTASQNEAVLTYHKVRGLHLRAVIFLATIYLAISSDSY